MNTISIDFGTSYTSAAWLNPITGQPEAIRFIENGKEKIPSIVYYPSDGDIVVGEAALAPLTKLNEYSPKQRLEIQASTVCGLKRRLLPEGRQALSGRSPVSHAEIISEIFKRIKNEAEINCFRGKRVEKVIVSHPVIISQAKKAVLMEAAVLSGFKVVELIEEPVAAAMGYTLNGRSIGQGILVFDFGGGTFDLAFVIRQDNDLFKVPIPTDGDDHCGGDDIDLALYEHWETLIERKYARSICNASQEVDIGFLLHCKQQKETLSDMEQCKFSMMLPPPGSLRVTRTIDRQTLDQLMRPVIDKTIHKTQAMLKRIEQANHKLDSVILVGGSSRIPMVMEQLKKILPIEPLAPLQNDVSVCMGALLPARSASLAKTTVNPKGPAPVLQEKGALLKNIGKGVTASPGDIWHEPLTEMKMVWVPPGSFRMGSPPSEKEREEDEGPLRIVTLDGFWMGQYPVTQGEWKKILNSNPSRFKNGDNYPVEYVSWKDTQNFIKNINQRHSGKYRFSLPTEAQWEYACRAGSTTPFSYGDTITTDQANFNGHLPYGDGPLGSYREKTTPVGTFPPNAFGLFDMHGNVWEWCQDRYGGEYSSTQTTNPKGPTSGVSRVLRGGCWNDGAWICRSAYRNLSTPSSRHSYTGFRVVMLPV